MFQIGTAAVGRVKVVEGMQVVTEFVTICWLPVFPLRSFYTLGSHTSVTSRSPWVGSLTLVSMNGIPLSSLDWSSVFLGYIRGFCAACALIGLFAIVPGAMVLSGEKLERLGTLILSGLIISFLLGTIGGLLSYSVSLLSPREKQIRSYSFELLGSAVDLAQVPVADAKELMKGLDDADDERKRLVRELILTRLEIANNNNVSHMEWKTDQLLKQLEN